MKSKKKSRRILLTLATLLEIAGALLLLAGYLREGSALEGFIPIAILLFLAGAALAFGAGHFLRESQR